MRRASGDVCVSARLCAAYGQNLPAFIVPTGRAGRVRSDGAAALRALIHPRRMPGIRRSTGAEPHLRSFTLRNSHRLSAEPKQVFAKRQPLDRHKSSEFMVRKGNQAAPETRNLNPTAASTSAYPAHSSPASVPLPRPLGEEPLCKSVSHRGRNEDEPAGSTGYLRE
jgi:hypothetical protein